MSLSELHSILLIDDNPNDRLLARRQLNKAFHQLKIEEVINPQQFDRAIAADRFDLVITDYQLGWSTGIDVLKAVKKSRPECPIVMFTNTGTQEIAVEAMKLGLSDYVLKSPRHFVRLAHTVRSTWQQFQTQLRAVELEGRLQALLNQLEVGIFRATPLGKLLDANAALFHMIGVESIAAAQTLLSTDRLALSEASKTLNPGESLTKEIQIAVNEQTRWLRINATLNAATREPVIDGIIEDITVRKQAEQAIAQSKAVLERKVKIRTRQLERSNHELESFAYSISHDLRTPIRQISSFAGIMQDYLDEQSPAAQTAPTVAARPPKAIASGIEADLPEESLQHYLSVISKLAVQAEGMIRALLNLSKVGSTAMVVEPVDMDSLVNREIEHISRERSVREGSTATHAAKSARPINFVVQPLPTVLCDRALIQSVWQNLLDNAIKFTRSQSNPQITIGAQPPTARDAFELDSDIRLEAAGLQAGSERKLIEQREEVVFFVQDNGIGFDSTQAEKIFGIFQQAHSKQDFGGVGIGLANVRRIINRHSGRVWAESEKNSGTTIFFSLPKAEAVR